MDPSDIEVNRQGSAPVFLFFNICLFIWLRRLLMAACGIFIASCGIFHWIVHGLSSCGVWALEHVALQPMGLAVVVHVGPAYPQHVGSQFLDQGSNWRPLHCKANS